MNGRGRRSRRRPADRAGAGSIPGLWWRQYFLLALLFAGFGVLAFRVVQLQTSGQERLQAQGDARFLREVVIQPARGRILDRNGRVLAVSTPVDSVWADPPLFCSAGGQWEPLLKKLDLKRAALEKACARRGKSGFMYLRRRLTPERAQEVLALGVPGVALQREYKRYYPAGPVAAHVVGFTDIDDRGQEGLEKAFDERLRGTPGRKKVLKDLAGHHVENVESLVQARDGEDIVISIDERLQYLAAGYLEQAVRENRAAGGSVVLLEVPSGEILAMVNSPQFNPNDRSTIRPGVFRNRAVTDVIEPGSTVKPFTVAMALESGRYSVHSMIDTSPGHMYVGRRSINDVHDYGRISVAEVVVKSSNVGVTKIALSLPPGNLYRTFRSVGFGRRTAQLPGEARGSLVQRKREIERATYSYGYGFNVTPLQLARAYTVFATDGELLPVTPFKRQPNAAVRGERVFEPATVRSIRAMLERVASPEGTARRAMVPRYRVGGKTGTTQKLINGSYKQKRYVALFAGLAPISRPRFVLVVVVDDPRGRDYYGGLVAAPVFSRLMEDALRLYNVPPDGLEGEQVIVMRERRSEAVR